MEEVAEFPKRDLVHSRVFLFGFYCWGWEFLTALLLFSCWLIDHRFDFSFLIFGGEILFDLICEFDFGENGAKVSSGAVFDENV